MRAGFLASVATPGDPRMGAGGAPSLKEQPRNAVRFRSAREDLTHGNRYCEVV
jgi:hypothetical protein